MLRYSSTRGRAALGRCSGGTHRRLIVQQQHQRRAFSMESQAACIADLAFGQRTMPLKKFKKEHGDLPRTVEQGWEIQTQARAVLAEQHDGDYPLAGWKIASTSKQVQELLGISSPFPGPVYRQTLLPSGVKYTLRDQALFGVECEVAFIIGTELYPVPEGHAYSEQDVREAVKAVAPAIEIAGSRLIADGVATTGAKNLDAPDLGAPLITADMGGNIALAVGEHRDIGAPGFRSSRDFSGVEVTLRVNHKEVAKGNGSMVLGSPLTALTWLANFLSSHRISLPAGSIVSTGTMTGATKVQNNDFVEADFGPLLGKVSIDFRD